MLCENLKKELGEIDRQIGEMKKHLLETKANERGTVRALVGDIKFLEMRKNRLLGMSKNGTVYCEIDVLIVSCPGEINGGECAEKCKEECNLSQSAYGRVVLKQDLLRAQYEKNLLIVDKESRLGKEIDKVALGGIVTFRNRGKYSLRIDGRKYFF